MQFLSLKTKTRMWFLHQITTGKIQQVSVKKSLQSNKLKGRECECESACECDSHVHFHFILKI